MKSSVEALEGNKVKVSVEVEEVELDGAIDAAFKRIAQEVRIPGFRPGKVPRKILEARIGVEAARQDALREALPEYYVQAVDEHDVDVIAPPEIDITSGQESGPVTFEAVVEVRPQIVVAGYDGLRVEVPSPSVSDEQIEAQLNRLRDTSSTLEDVDRPAADGDHATIDIAGSLGGEPVEGLTADDYLYEVGSGTAVPELDEHLRGARVGDILVFDAAHPDPEVTDLLTFRVLVKAVQAKVLPDADDAWAAEVSEFETLAELRDDLRTRLGAVTRVQTVMSMRQGVVEALVGLVDDEPPAAMVDGEVQRQLEDLAHRLSHQGATIEQYLEATGSSAQELLDGLRVEATSAAKADLAIRAVIAAEGIEPDEAMVNDELTRMAAQLETTVDDVRSQLERAGRMAAVRSDVQRRQAFDWLSERAEIVDPDGNPVDRSLLEPPATTDPEAIDSEAIDSEATDPDPDDGATEQDGQPDDEGEQEQDD
ncbi:MAG: trigger factor [Acidimicrobiia bacterium]